VLSIETGELARQADGAVMVQYGESIVLATAVAVEDSRNVPFFPLTIEYREKQYAAGQFPGGIFKREGRPTTKETLTCRVIDRPIRPLFPKGYHQDVQIMITVLSADQVNDPDILGMIGASAALSISSIPFLGPIGACRVGLVDDVFVINPTHEQRLGRELNLVVASTPDGIAMVEGSAEEIPEDDLVTAIQCGHDVNVEVCALINELVEKVGRPERQWVPKGDPDKARSLVEPKYYDRFAQAHKTAVKDDRAAAIRAILDEAEEEFLDEEDEGAPTFYDLSEAFGLMEDRAMREQIVREGRRYDGRALDQVRDISCVVALLPRTHGSAVFTRGETQALAVTTLGTVQDEQRVLDPLVEEPNRKFMLHYNFPPFSVGEVKPVRGPSRRDIGHGDLAERALIPVLPDTESFPYTIRVVSDILESNGSSSMASVCGGTLSLMDAGVPITNPVAGIAMGLIREQGQVYILSDIAGAEDHHGDMDLKVAGTQHGVTAIQMDLKVTDVSLDTLRQAFMQAREARLQILKVMLSTLERPRADISPYAPVLVQVKIDPDMIGKLIGPGGKNIKGLQEKYECSIEVEDDGSVTVSSPRGGRADECAKHIQQMGQTAKVGAIYDGVVTELKDFGAIVELFPGSDGLCHISQLDEEYVKDVSSVCKVGDTIKVKVLSVEDGRVRLSRKAAMKELAGE
jgi:polyribonucleotide nucleotidyltransferase